MGFWSKLTDRVKNAFSRKGKDDMPSLYDEPSLYDATKEPEGKSIQDIMDGIDSIAAEAKTKRNTDKQHVTEESPSINTGLTPLTPHRPPPEPPNKEMSGAINKNSAPLIPSRPPPKPPVQAEESPYGFLPSSEDQSKNSAPPSPPINQSIIDDPNYGNLSDVMETAQKSHKKTTDTIYGSMPSSILEAGDDTVSLDSVTRPRADTPYSEAPDPNGIYADGSQILANARESMTRSSDTDISSIPKAPEPEKFDDDFEQMLIASKSELKNEKSQYGAIPYKPPKSQYGSIPGNPEPEGAKMDIDSILSELNEMAKQSELSGGSSIDKGAAQKPEAAKAEGHKASADKGIS